MNGNYEIQRQREWKQRREKRLRAEMNEHAMTDK